MSQLHLTLPDTFVIIMTQKLRNSEWSPGVLTWELLGNDLSPSHPDFRSCRGVQKHGQGSTPCPSLLPVYRQGREPRKGKRS